MNDNQLLPVEGKLSYTVDFSSELPSGVTVSSVAWSVSPTATLSGQTVEMGFGSTELIVSPAALTFTGQEVDLDLAGHLDTAEVTFEGQAITFALSIPVDPCQPCGIDG